MQPASRASIRAGLRKLRRGLRLVMAGRSLLLAFRANPPEHQVMSAELKAVGIPDFSFQARDVFHIHIKDPSTSQAFYMVMVMAPVVEPVGPARSFYFSDFPAVGKLV